MSNVTNDLPTNSAGGEQPLLIDGNAGFYETQPRGKSYVFVERYVQNKDFFAPLPEGTASSIRRETYLIKTTNYQDMGGGLVMFDRHYAQIPLVWFDYQVVAVTTTIERGLTTATYYINPSFSGGFQRTVSVLAKATRKYYLEENIPTNLNFTAPEQSRPGSFTGEEEFQNIILREDDVSIYQGNIYQVTTFEGSVTVKTP
jgi:hypothetical protein